MTTYYGLRTCDEDMQSYNEFQWPSSGTVEAPDWLPTSKYGNGLHAFLNGEGDCCLASWEPNAYWLVVSFSEYIDLGGKVKFPSCEVLFAKQDRQEAIDFLKTKIGTSYRVIGDTLTGGDNATLIGGDYATLTAGHHATLIGGYKATLTGGDHATLTGGDYATITGGHYATLTGGNLATLIGCDYATLTGGYNAKLTGGDNATLTGGRYATLIFTTPKRGTHVAVVGENGIQPNKPYKLVDGVITLHAVEVN